MLLAVEGAPEVDEDRPQDGRTEQNGENSPPRCDVKAPNSVGTVPLAEAVFLSRVRAPFAGVAQMQALRRGGNRSNFMLKLHGVVRLTLSNFTKLRNAGN